ncbi:MAG: esterase/lipase family protein, partial [Opitutaceae bacterium]
MKLLFVHGWSVTSTETYGGMPEALRRLARGRGLELRIADVFLGRYISFRDEARMGDLERAFEQAVRDALKVKAGGAIPRFSCITHSTGGPLVRCWVDRYYGAKGIVDCPLEHLIMLAPPNHGSALAQLGKATLGRLKAWFEDIEPGCQILDWLELGSAGQRALNERFISYNLPKSHAEGGRHFPIVLTGETIDPALYDFVNSYTGEAGSDGVVRAAAANLDARWLTLEQTDEPVKVRGLPGTTALRLRGNGVRRPPLTPFRIVPEASHSGSKIGIIKSVKPDNAAEKEVVAEVLDALQIADGDDYNAY